MSDDKVVLRISVNEAIKNSFRADSISDGSNMSIDIEQLMLDRNRQRRYQGVKAVQKKSVDSDLESTDLKSSTSE
jgi:hypothetical protein